MKSRQVSLTYMKNLPSVWANQKKMRPKNTAEIYLNAPKSPKGPKLSLYDGVFSHSLLSILLGIKSFFSLFDTLLDIYHDLCNLHFGGRPSCILGTGNIRYQKYLK